MTQCVCNAKPGDNLECEACFPPKGFDAIQQGLKLPPRIRNPPPKRYKLCFCASQRVCCSGPETIKSFSTKRPKKLKSADEVVKGVPCVRRSSNNVLAAVANAKETIQLTKRDKVVSGSPKVPCNHALATEAMISSVPPGTEIPHWAGLYVDGTFAAKTASR